MPTSKEEIRLKYGLTDEEFDTIEALALRPICEHCARPLPPDSLEALICSFECTFCADCTDALDEICPNCGGELLDRPARVGEKLKSNPASTVRRYRAN